MTDGTAPFPHEQGLLWSSGCNCPLLVCFCLFFYCIFIYEDNLLRIVVRRALSNLIFRDLYYIL